MTSKEARNKAELMAREHPDRDHFHWFAKHIDGGVWTVVQVARPVSLRSEPVAPRAV
jgi:hypothetical protein